MSLQITWDEHNNLIIRDVHQKWHSRVRALIMERHVKQHRIYTQLKLQEEQSFEEVYNQYLTHILQNECSMVAMNEGTNQILAVALVKWMTLRWKSWTALRAYIRMGKFSELLALRRNIFLGYHKLHPQHEFDSLHMFEYWISDELKLDYDFMRKFFNAICEVARHMKMPRVTFVSLTVEEQHQLETADFEELDRSIYSLYLVKGRRPFAHLRDIDENDAVLYEKVLPPLQPFHEMEVREVRPRVTIEWVREYEDRKLTPKPADAPWNKDWSSISRMSPKERRKRDSDAKRLSKKEVFTSVKDE